MEKITTVVNDSERIESFNLNQNQHDIAVEMLENNLRVGRGGFTLDLCDSEEVNIWISDAFAYGEEELAQFLSSAIAGCGTVFGFIDHLGDFYQCIGYVVLY